MRTSREIRHQKYLIRLMQMGELWEARVYVAGAKPGSPVVIRHTAATEESLVSAVTNSLDDRDSAARAKRRKDAKSQFEVPTTEEYLEALQVCWGSLNDRQIAMLTAHAAAGSKGMTVGDLARSGGYKNYETANALYGKVGTKMAAALGVSAPPSTVREGPVQTAVLASWYKPEDVGEPVGRWFMYPELLDALEKNLRGSYAAS